MNETPFTHLDTESLILRRFSASDLAPFLSYRKDDMTFQVTSLEQRPDLADNFGRMSEGPWPRFLLHADTLYWGLLFDEFAAFRIAFLDSVAEATPKL